MKRNLLPLFMSIGIAILYFTFAVLLLNISLVLHTLFSATPILDKLALYLALLESSWGALRPLDFYLLVITALLVGINVTLSLLLLTRMKKMGTVSLSFSSGTMVGVFSAGCSTCGFSALSLFGLSGTVALFPLHGAELYIIAITLLTLSLYYNITALQKPLMCKIKK